MKTLLITTQDELPQRFQKLYGAEGAELILYRYPLKAMDNLEEIKPDLVLFSASDFPRHWKAFLVYLRFFRPKTELPFVLVAGEDRDTAFKTEAEVLEVDGIVGEDLRSADKILEGLLASAGREQPQPPAQARIQGHLQALPGSAALLFTNPETLTLVETRVVRLLPHEILFRVSPAAGQSLRPGLRIPAASLKYGDRLFTLDLEIIALGTEGVSALFPNPGPGFSTQS